MKEWVTRIAPFPVLLAVVLALPGGAAPADESDEVRRARVVARVGQTTITVGDIESRLGRHMRPGMFQDKERLRELVASLLDRELLVQEARKRKLDEKKRVVNHLKRILYNQIQTRYVTEKMPLDSITMKEIQAYYDEHRDEYNQPTLVRAYHILLEDKAEALTVLEQVKQEGMDLRQFKVLAGERSQDEVSKKRGGDLRYFSAEGKVWTSEEVVPEPLARAAFTVEILVRASVIVLEDEDRAREAHGKAMMPGLGDQAFAKLASKLKAEGAAIESGDLGYFNLEGVREGADDKIPWDVTRAAFSIRESGKTYPKVVKVDGKFHIIRVTDRKDPGNLYPEVVETEKGFHVVWVVNRRPAVHKGVEEMEPAIRQRIWQQKKKEFMENLVEELKKKYKVEVHEDRLKDVVIDLGAKPTGKEAPIGPPPQPVAVPRPNPPPVSAK